MIWTYFRVMVQLDVWGSVFERDEEDLEREVKDGWEPYAVTSFRDHDGISFEVHHLRRPTEIRGTSNEGSNG